MKRLAVILVSVVFLYGGVAWALTRCLSQEHRHEQSETGHSTALGETLLKDSHDHTAPVIHCPMADLRIGPAAQGGSIQQIRGQRGSITYGSLSSENDWPASGNPRWLDAVFRPILAFLMGGGVSRHLVFSILQI